MASIRRTYFDQLLKNTKFSFPYYFYDGMGKVSLDLTAKSNLAVAGLFGEDVFNYTIKEDDEDVGDLDMRWGNRGLSVKWLQYLTPKLHGEVLFALSNFHTDMNLTFLKSTSDFRDEVIDYTVKGDFSYVLAPKHTLDFGFDAKNITFDFEVKMDTLTILNEVDTARIRTFYLQDKWELNPLCFLQIGIRPTYFTPGSHFRWDPRLGLKYRVATNTTINASFGFYSQFLTTVGNGEELLNLFDIWLSPGEDYAPGLSKHYILGMEQWISNNFNFTIEGYYKTFEYLLQLKEKGTFDEDAFYVGSGYATGLDFLFKKTAGKFSGEVSYSLSLTKRTFDDEIFCPKYDQRHNMNLGFGMGLPWGLNMNLKWKVGTGSPYPGVIGTYYKTEHDFSGDSTYTKRVHITAPKDYYRYPVYHRADLDIRKAFNWKLLKCECFVGVMNIYNHENIFLYIWDIEKDPAERIAVTMFPIFPSVGFNIKF